jgi:hypothetical protein
VTAQLQLINIIIIIIEEIPYKLRHSLTDAEHDNRHYTERQFAFDKTVPLQAWTNP